MDFGLSEQQEEFKAYARGVLERESPPARARQMLEHPTAFDMELYARLADLGWLGLAIAEEHGGQGVGYVELAVLMEELGRVVLPGPFFATVGLAAPLIADAGGARAGELLEGIAAGSTIATVAYAEDRGQLDAGDIDLFAIPRGREWVLDGSKDFVLDAHVADIVIVAARSDRVDDASHGVTLFAVPMTARGTSVQPYRTLDSTRRLCRVDLHSVRVSSSAVLGQVDHGWSTLSRAVDRSIALLCAEMVGGAQKVLDMSVRHAMTREQFGRPIGMFQAVKHRCANMLVEVELARSAMYYAAWAAASNSDELASAAALAKAYCGESYVSVAKSGVLAHGGIAFTWEHDMHLYLKRAHADEVLLGDSRFHRERVARALTA